MKNQPLVSIITPCYNMEKYIHRLLDSVLNQTYKNIELIVVDDGSTDNSKNIIDGYKVKFEEIGMKLVYIYQENSGQAEAINKGLAVMTGKYLTWIDSDDFLKNTSVEKRVVELEKTGEGNLCITQYEYVNENNVDDVKYIGKRVKPNGNDEFFKDLILCKNIVFAGGVMVRTSDWLKANSSNHIYPSREGQNWQLMLPITYHYKCIYIEEPLYVVVEHGDSHSRTERTLEQNVQRCLNFIKLQENTIKAMNISDEKECLDICYQKQRKDILNCCAKQIDFKSYIRGKINQNKYELSRNNFLRKLLGKKPI